MKTCWTLVSALLWGTLLPLGPAGAAERATIPACMIVDDPAPFFNCFYTHAQTLYGNGTKSGLKVFQIAIDRLHRHFGDRIQWMTGLEIARRFCPPGR